MEEELEKCRYFAKACGAAIFLDYATPRPGLSTIAGEREGLPGIGFLLSGSTAVFSCYTACKRCLFYSGTSIGCRLASIWSRSCREALVYGNTSAGSLLLLVFQAGSLGYSLATRGGDSVESVMGSARELVEMEGVDASIEFYRVYRWLSPSYLGRIGYSGLPDILSDTYLDSIPPFNRLVCEAGLYDNVLGDLCTGFTVSLGYTLNLLRDRVLQGGARKAVAEATNTLVRVYGDFLLKRKASGKKGPGAVADIVVNSVARLFYEAFSRRTLIPL